MAILSSIDIGSDERCVTVNHDPAAVATDVPMGSIIVDANGKLYRKLDDGSTTNVTLMALKYNLTATTDPTVNDDVDLFYEVGSLWINVTTDKGFICLDATDGAAVWQVVGALVETINFIIDGGGSPIVAAEEKGHVVVDFACVIESVTLLADQSGDIVIDIFKDTYSNFPPTVADTITASAKPTLSSAQKYQDSTLTGWTKTIAAGDVLAFNVDSCATVTRVLMSLKVRRT